MKFQSWIAVYVLFWAFSVFLVLPFGVRTAEEAGAELVPGQAESAPHAFSLGRIALRTTMVATPLFLIYLLNYIYGWITPEMLDWTQW